MVIVSCVAGYPIQGNQPPQGYSCIRYMYLGYYKVPSLHVFIIQIAAS